jgi:hypothetical protein
MLVDSTCTRIHDDTCQYKPIHEFMNSRFFRGIYVGTTVHVLEYIAIHASRCQFKLLHDSACQYV